MDRKGRNKALSTMAVTAIMVMSVISLLAIFGQAADEEDSGAKIIGFVSNEYSNIIYDSTVHVELTDLHTGDSYVVDANAEDGGYMFDFDEKGIRSNAGYFHIRAYANGYYDDGEASDEIFISPGESCSKDFILKKISNPYKISGHVKDDNGDPVAGAEVMFWSEVHLTELAYSFKTNSSGYYNLTVFEATYSVLCSVSPDYEPFFDDDVHIDQDGFVYDIIMPKNEGMYGKWLVKGKVRDQGTDLPIKGDAYLIDKDTLDIVDKTEEARRFQLQGYPGDFILVVDSPGHAPNINYSLNIGQNGNVTFDDIYLDTVEKEEISHEIVFQDMEEGTVSYTWTLSPNSMVNNLDFSGIGDVRMQVDLEEAFGLPGESGDGYVSEDEALDFADWIDTRLGVPRLNTEGFLEINGTYYNVTGIGPVFINGLVDTEVGSKDTFTLKFNWILEVVDAEKVKGEVLSVSVSDMFDNEELDLEFDSSRLEVVNSSISSECGEKTGIARVKVSKSMDFELREKEEPVMETTKLRYNDTDEEVVTISGTDIYIVKHETEVELTAMVFDTVDHPEGGDDELTYTWTVTNEETDALYEQAEGDEAVINFTEAGEFNITLTALDTSGETNESYKTLRVDNAPPTLSESLLIFTPATKIVNESDASEYLDVTEKELVINTSKLKDYITLAGDVEGEIGSIAFYYGAENPKLPTGDLVKLSWKEPGTYNVTVNVSDVVGNYKEITIPDIIVRDRTAPTPVIKIDGEEIDITREQRVNISEEVEFDASESFDEKNSKHYNLTYFKWQIMAGNETVYKSEGTNEPMMTHTFQDADNELYEVNLTLQDDVGNEKTRTFDVRINMPALKFDFLNVSDSKPMEEDKITVTTRINNTGGSPARNIVVKFQVRYGDNTKTLAKENVEALEPGETKKLEHKFNVGYHDKGADIIVTVEAEGISETVKNKEHIKVEKKPLMPDWAYVAIAVVVLVLLIGGYYYYIRRKEEQLLMKGTRKKKKDEED